MASNGSAWGIVSMPTLCYNVASTERKMNPQSRQSIDSAICITMHHLTESTRRHYLDAMGLTQWYTRRELPGAARLLWENDVVEPVSPTPVVPDAQGISGQTAEPPRERREKPPESPPPKPHAELLQEAGSETTVGMAHDESDTPVSEATGSESGHQAGIEFVQRWWARDGWCIVDTRAKQMPEDQQKAADRLMAGLAQAVTGERKPVVAHRIDWPLFVNRSIPHDEEEARFYLSQKWRAVQQQCEVRHLILLGEHTPSLLSCSPPDDQSDAWTHDGMNCIQGPGSSELMHLPGEKRAFWNRLRAWLNSL